MFVAETCVADREGLFAACERLCIVALFDKDARSVDLRPRAFCVFLAERGDESFTHPYVGTRSLADTVAQFYTNDVFMHTWDLARASGQDDNLDPAVCAEMFEGMSAMADMLRSSGQFGEQQPVRDDAGPKEKLMAFIGRDPYWKAS